MPKINPLMFLAAPYAVNEFAVKPMSEIYGAYRGIKDQFTKDAENAEQTRLQKRRYDPNLTDEELKGLAQQYTGTDPNFISKFGKETTEAVSEKEAARAKQDRHKLAGQQFTRIIKAKDPVAEVAQMEKEGQTIDLTAFTELEKGVGEARNLIENTFKRVDAEKKDNARTQFQAEVAPVFIDTSMTPQQKVQFIYKTATKYGLDPDATVKDYMALAEKAYGPTQTGGVGRTSFKFRTNELGKVDPIAQSVAPVRGEGGDGGSKDYKAAVKERWKDFNKAQTQYLKAVGGQEVLAFDEAGGPLGSTKRTFSTDELNLLRSVMNDKRRAYQDISGEKTRVINDKPKTGKQTKPTSAVKVTYDKDGNLVIQR